PDPQAARREELAPDRRLWLENPEGLRAFFYIELDNGTMTPDRYRQKLAKYEALAASDHPAREYGLLCAAYGIEPRPLAKHPFRVLTIATDTKERRADERRRNDLLMQAVRLRSFKRFLFTTLHEAVAPGAFFGPHWLRGKEYAPIADQLALWDGPDRGQRERQEYVDAAIERMERQGLLGE
ncbi:MAG: replication-relaxation family protein, partial [Candidatus Methylomirabilis sp.]|nr:replication-relaxation family protein [Deltaproteobacteria bacterium]